MVQWLRLRLLLLWVPRVQSLVAELGSRKLYSVAKNLKKFKKERYQRMMLSEFRKNQRV